MTVTWKFDEGDKIGFHNGSLTWLMARGLNSLSEGLLHRATWASSQQEICSPESNDLRERKAEAALFLIGLVTEVTYHHIQNILLVLQVGSISCGKGLYRAWIPGGRCHRGPSWRLATTIYNGVSPGLVPSRSRLHVYFKTNQLLAQSLTKYLKFLKGSFLLKDFWEILEVATLPYGTILPPSVAATLLHQVFSLRTWSLGCHTRQSLFQSQGSPLYSESPFPSSNQVFLIGFNIVIYNFIYIYICSSSPILTQST